MDDDLTIRNKLVKQVVDLLARGQYAQLEQMSHGSRLSPAEMQEAVEQYGRTLLPFPEDAMAQIDYIAYDGTRLRGWSVVVPLFTQEEGLSDLSLELSLIEAGPGKYDVEIDDLHVL